VARLPKRPSARPSPSRRLPAKSSSSGSRTRAPSGSGHRTLAASTPASTRGLADRRTRTTSRAPSGFRVNRPTRDAEETAKPRRRRNAASARAAILDAAERQLVSAGPSGIRLQEVAADAGVSHPTVLHHFGTREGLVKAVVTRSLAEVNARLVNTISRSTGDTAQVAAMLDGVFDALANGGRARVIMWLALEGQRIEADARLSTIVEATHSLRKAKHAGKRRPPPREDTAHVVVLAALALVGAAVMGPALLVNAGLSDDAAAERRFRAWLATMLTKHLDET
jgi:AcrR family transcriptional regulator